jgi:hypothetical protein
MGIIGAHAIIYSKSAEADRAFLQDVLGFGGVDVGGGWMIYGLPPGEVAVHPSDENDVHELYLMVDDLDEFLADMDARHIVYTDPSQQGWGMLTSVSLPGGGKLGVYQPRHASPPPMKVKAAAAKQPAAKKAAPAKKAAAKPAAKKPAPAKKAAAKPAAKKPAPPKKRR